MANPKNYQSPLTSFYGNRYTVSRIVANRQDNLLNMEVPADFSEKILQNNVEIHVYSLADNSLIYSDYIRQTNGTIYTETLQYTDGTLRKLLYIDFAKATGISLPPGRYSVTLNFFADELGSYATRPFKINRISTSRNEVELKLTDLQLLNDLDEFALPRISTKYVYSALTQIFNQSGSNELNLPMSAAKIDSSSLYQNFDSGSGERLVKYNFDDDVGSFIGINTIAQRTLDIAYPIAHKQISDAVLIGSRSFTEVELSNIVVNAIDVAYDEILKDEENNPQQYRFDLL